jgi:hypothetical protein
VSAGVGVLLASEPQLRSMLTAAGWRRIRREHATFVYVLPVEVDGATGFRVLADNSDVPRDVHPVEYGRRLAAAVRAARPVALDYIQPGLVWRSGAEGWEAGDELACAPHRSRTCRACDMGNGAGRAFALDLRTRKPVAA